jgi:uncharacterized protein (TIGR00255 family)
LKSMTGFGYGEHREEKRQLSMTLKSYNNRFLDLFVYLPPALSVLEPQIRRYLSERVLRGRVELYLKAIELEEAPRVLLDRSAVRAYAQVLRELAREAGIRERLRLSHLLKLEGVIRTEVHSDPQELWPVLEALLARTFREFDEARAREGEATRRDVLAILSGFEGQIARIEALAPQLEERLKKDLRARFREVLGDSVEESRLLAETAVLLARSDVHEELMRVRAHLEGFRAAAAEGGAVGKKLDFLCQELGREVNTLGAKNALLEVDAAVVALKDALEKIREQVRNVE